MGRKINYDDLFKGLPNCGTSFVGGHESVNGIGAKKTVSNCLNTYDDRIFTDSIPAVGKAGYKWSI